MRICLPCDSTRNQKDILSAGQADGSDSSAKALRALRLRVGLSDHTVGLVLSQVPYLSHQYQWQIL